MNTKPIGPFLGINNRLPDFALRIDTRQVQGNYLRTADNVDIDNSGSIRRREADKLIQAMAGPHSLYMVSPTSGYVVRGAVIYAVTLPSYSETLFKILTSNDPVSWCASGDDLYYSNGTDSGRITSGVWYALGLPTPDAPICETVADPASTLRRGAYQVALSYFNSVTGEEGGISASTNQIVNVLDSEFGAITVTLPSGAGGATHINVYFSTINGSIPMLARSLAVGTGSTTFDTPPVTGRESTGRYEDPLPAGALFMSNGRLCSFKDSTVYVGLPFRPGYYLPAEGYIPFPEPVSIAIENQGGTFIAADKTYWVPGDLGDVKDTIATVLPYGAVPGTSFSTPNKSTVGWFGKEGFVLGATSGEVEAVMSDNITLTPPTIGCSTVRTTNGYRRVVGCGWCLNLDNEAATTYSDFAFTSLSGGYGTKLDGVYTLTGSDATDARIGFGKLNFKTEELKHLPYVYLGVASGVPMDLNVVCPDKKGVLQDFTYAARSCGAELSMQRVDLGKGLRASWFDLTVYNQSGSEFTLASVSFTPLASGRRI